MDVKMNDLERMNDLEKVCFKSLKKKRDKLNLSLMGFTDIDEKLSVSISSEVEKAAVHAAEKYYQSSEEIYTQTIQTSINTARELLANNHVALVGLTQSDKSASQFLSATIYAAIHYLKTNQLCVPLFTCPHSNGKFVGQLSTKFSVLSPLVNYIQITYNKKTIAIKDYMSLVSRVLTKVASSSQKIIHHMENGGAYYPIRICAAIQKDFGLFIKHLVEKHNCLPIIIRDEVHLNNREGSIEHQTYMEDQEDGQVFGNCLDLFNSKKALFMPVSATPWNSLHFKMVKIEIDKEFYSGFPQFYRYQGQEIWLDVPEHRHPEYTTFAEIHWFFKKYTRAITCYREEDKYYKYINEESHEKFQERYAKAVYEIISSQFQAKRYTLKGKLINGMLIRAFNSNKLTDQLIRQIKKINKNYNFNFYSMYEDKTASVGDFIKSHHIDLDDDEKKNIIFLTGSGRASDSFPAKFGYGLDFTNEASNWTALFQGIIGRVTGYNKNPIIILSEENKNLLETHRNNGWSCQDQGRLRGKFGKPLVIGLQEESKPPKYITVTLKTLQDNCLSSKDLKNFTDFKENINFHHKECGGRFGDSCKINIANFLSDDIIRKVVEDEDPRCEVVSLKNTSEEKGTPYKYFPNKYGHVCLAKRTTEEKIGNTNDNRLILRFNKNGRFAAISFLANPKQNQTIENNGHTAGLISNE